MQFFKTGAIANWHKWNASDLMQFDADGSRTVQLDFNTNEVVEVWASQKEDMTEAVMVAASGGQFRVSFTVASTAFVQISAHEDTTIFCRGHAPDMRVPASEAPAFTSINPTRRTNTEFDRMMMIMRHNENMRQAEFDRQLKQAFAEPAPTDAAVTELEATLEPVQEPQVAPVEPGAEVDSNATQ